jgi:hypothetical protein
MDEIHEISLHQLHADRDSDDHSHQRTDEESLSQLPSRIPNRSTHHLAQSNLALLLVAVINRHSEETQGRNQDRNAHECDDEHHHIVLVLEIILQSIIHILHLHFRRNAHQFLSHLLAGTPDSLQRLGMIATGFHQNCPSTLLRGNVAKQSLLALKSAMNFPVDEELKLAALVKTQKKSLESGMLKESEKEAGSQSVEPNKTENQGADERETLVLPVNYETVYQGFQNISPDLKSAEYEVERARYDYKIAKGRLLPSLSLGGGISTNYYKNLSQKGQYDGFASQFRNNQGEYLALTLSIPIYNSDRWHSVKKARNDWQLAQVNLEETRRKLHDQIAQAVMDAEGYAKELHQMQKKVASDSLAYYMSSRKFEEGMLSTFDLHTAAQTLLESRIKELQMQMLLIIKQRLVAYYQGENLIK